MSWKDLIVRENGKLCIKRFWINVAYLIATFCVVYLTIQGKLSWDIFIVYLGIVAGSPVALKFIESKYTTPK